MIEKSRRARYVLFLSKKQNDQSQKHTLIWLSIKNDVIYMYFFLTAKTKKQEKTSGKRNYEHAKTAVQTRINSTSNRLRMFFV